MWAKNKIINGYLVGSKLHPVAEIGLRIGDAKANKYIDDLRVISCVIISSNNKTGGFSAGCLAMLLGVLMPPLFTIVFGSLGNDGKVRSGKHIIEVNFSNG